MEQCEGDNKKKNTVFVDDLLGIISQLPNSFDFGTILVELTCVDVSSIRLVFGSNCGAIFIFDCQTEKLRKPLRTASEEYVTCIRQNGLMIAAGHHSGSLMIIRVPEQQSRRIQQRVEKDRHRGSAIRCLEWSQDGTKLFSADHSGVVILTHVDFEQKVFDHSFVYCGPSPIRLISPRKSEISIESIGGSTVVVNIATTDVENVDEQKECSTSVILLFWIGDLQRYLCLLKDDFSLYVYDRENLAVPFKVLDFREEMKKLDEISVIVNGQEENSQVAIDSLKILIARYEFDGNFSIVTDKGDVFLVKIDEKFSLRIVLRAHIAVLTSKVFDLVSCDGILYVLVNKRRVVSVSNGRTPENWRNRVPTTTHIPSLSYLMDSTSSFFERVIVPKEETINRIGSAIGEGINSLDQLSSKIAPKIDELVNNVQNHVDTSSSGSQDGLPIFFDERRERSAEAGIEICEGTSCYAPMAVVRKEKIQRKKRNGEDHHESTSEVEDVESDSSTSTSQIAEDTLKEIRNVIANIGIKNCGPSPGISKKNIPRIHEKGCSSANDGGESSVEVNGGKRERSSCSRSRQNSHCVSPEKHCANVEDPEIERELDKDEAIDLLLKRREQNDHEPSLELSPPAPSVAPYIIEMRQQRVQRAVVVNDQVDIWSQVTLPYTPSFLSVTSESIILSHRKRNPKWTTLDQLGGRKIQWYTASWPASQLDCNEDGSLLWRVHKNVAYSTPHLETVSKWTEVASDGGGVLQCSFSERDAWYITKRGVSLQMELPEHGIFHEAECDWPLKCLTASHNAVWAIRSDTGSLVVRVGLNRCRMGYDWVEIKPEGADRLVSVSLCDSAGFCIDESGRVWMVKGVDEHHPYGNSHQFLRVCTPLDRLNMASLPSPSEWRIRASSRGLFLSVKRTLYMSRGTISGHGFTRVVPEKLSIYDNFSLLAAGGMSDENIDGLFACRPNSEVFCYRIPKKSFLTYMLPLADGQLSMIISICAIPGSLFMLDSCGSIFERAIDGETILPGEAQWNKVDRNGECLISFAASANSMWTISSSGTILARIEVDSEQKFVTVDPPANIGNVKIEEIRCSRDGRYVWILSVTGRKCWARSDVSKERPTGVKWIEACSDPPLIELGVGCNVVWGLSADGVLYRLRGLASGNPAGNYWRPLPVKLRAISIDANNALWGVDENSQLVRHVLEIHGSNHSMLQTSAPRQDSFEFV